MTLWVPAKPGAKERETLVDEATAEQLMRDLAVVLAGIRAAKRAVADMLTPRGTDPIPSLPDCALCGRPAASHGVDARDDDECGCHAWRSAAGVAMDGDPCPSTLDGEPCTERGTHRTHYGKPDDLGIRRMWVNGDEAPGDPPCTECGVVRSMHEDAFGRTLNPAECTGYVAPEPVLCQAHGGEFGPADCDVCAAEREQADPGYLEDAAAHDHDDNGYAALARGELCDAERDGRRCKLEPHEDGEHDCDGWRWSDVTYSVVHRHKRADEDAAAQDEDAPRCGLPVWGDEDRPCELAPGHGPTVSCPGKRAASAISAPGGAQ